jgi:rRNA-processing protein FCF1
LRAIMSIKEVVIDTNFFMVPFQFNVDIITELEKVLPSYKLTTPSFVINELKGLKRNNKGKIRLNANLALKLANSSKVEIKDISLLENETVDDALLRVSEVLATNDIELKKRAKAKGITVVYLRQKNYITVDGKI